MNGLLVLVTKGLLIGLARSAKALVGFALALAIVFRDGLGILETFKLKCDCVALKLD